MDPAIFKAYDIRGLYPEQLGQEAAWKIGHATAQFLRSLLRGYERGQANAQSLCVGHDMRTHSPILVKSLIEGMNATGANVIDIGMIDTPQMYFAINHLTLELAAVCRLRLRITLLSITVLRYQACRPSLSARKQG